MQKIKRKNTRRFKRFRADYLIKYDPEGKGEFRLTNAQDLSAGGIRFWSDQSLPESSTMEVSILVPPLGREVNALAEVRRTGSDQRSSSWSVAAGFLDIPQDDRQAIDEFAEKLASDREAKFWVDHQDVVTRRA